MSSHQLVWLIRFHSHHCLSYNLSAKFVSLYALFYLLLFLLCCPCMEKGPWPDSHKAADALCPHTHTCTIARDWCSYSDKRYCEIFKGVEVKILGLQPVLMVHLPVILSQSDMGVFCHTLRPVPNVSENFWENRLLTEGCALSIVKCLFWLVLVAWRTEAEGERIGRQGKEGE